MKVVSSLKTLKVRDRNCQIVKRRGRLYVINKKNPRAKLIDFGQSTKVDIEQLQLHENIKKNPATRLGSLHQQRKLKMEKKLEASGLNYTIFQCSGFFQGLISQYALPILENEKAIVRFILTFSFGYFSQI